MKSIVKRFLEKLGYEIHQKGNLDLFRVSSLFSINALKMKSKAAITSIVFSKDRAMQLNAFIESYYTMISNNNEKLYVLYKCTSDGHSHSYRD